MAQKIDDSKLVDIFLEPIRKCAEYKPAFGQRRSDGLTVTDFRTLYEQDSFYSWIGLDDPLMYAAHKAAGGITSVYRQVGVGSERLLRAILMESFFLTSEQIDWRYQYPKPDGQEGTHILDARISIEDLNESNRRRIQEWLDLTKETVASSHPGEEVLKGAVFEIRQGYKSADSKRQNADLRFGIRAYQARLLPVFMILSNQVSDPIVRRYRADGMLVLTGIVDSDTTKSTFAFFEKVVGFSLAGFFGRNTVEIRSSVKKIIASLLSME